MLKVLAAVLAVLSAVISITVYSSTLPAVQKQAADNAEKIEQIESTIENIPTEEKNLYLHKLSLSHTATTSKNFTCNIYLQVINNSNEQLTLEYLKNYNPKIATGYVYLTSNNYYIQIAYLETSRDNYPYPGAKSYLYIYYFTSVQSSSTPTNVSDETENFSLTDTVKQL